MKSIHTNDCTSSVRVTTRGRYAVMAMIELARRGVNSPVPLFEIAATGGISLSYLEQLFAGLRRNGLVRSHRGPGGGYILARAPNTIMIADIMISAEDSVPGRRQDGSSSRGHAETDILWDYIGQILHRHLETLSLADVMQGFVFKG
jgi:Rrf2 family transcriptional regulator, iron-sulfur cluster assembly transcription factor